LVSPYDAGTAVTTTCTSCVCVVNVEDGMIKRQHSARAACVYIEPNAGLLGSAFTGFDTPLWSLFIVLFPPSANVAAVYSCVAVVSGGAIVPEFHSVYVVVEAPGQPPEAVADEPNTACTPNAFGPTVPVEFAFAHVSFVALPDTSSDVAFVDSAHFAASPVELFVTVAVDTDASAWFGVPVQFVVYELDATLSTVTDSVALMVTSMFRYADVSGGSADALPAKPSAPSSSAAPSHSAFVFLSFTMFLLAV